jgi:tol-pal system protein YbgF
MSGGSQDPETALKQFDDNKAKAQLGSKLEELRNDMADLRGKLEEATHIIDMQAAKMEKLEQQLAAAQVAPAPTPESATPSPAPNTSTVNTTVVASENVAPILNDTGTVANEIKSLDPKDAYEQSKEYIRQGDYANAEIALKTFVESFPSHELIGSGYYYLGELYYIQQKFKEALSIFAEGYKTQPSGDKAPDTLLKMAQCFDALKQSKEACATLTRLHKAFPRLDSNIKATANKLKTTLKCSGKK